MKRCGFQQCLHVYRFVITHGAIIFTAWHHPLFYKNIRGLSTGRDSKSLLSQIRVASRSQ